MKYSYQVLGVPVPLARPRFSRNGIYDSQVSLKKEFVSRIQEDLPSIPLEGPLSLEVTFYFAIPAFYGKVKRAEFQSAPCPKKPDLSNLIKFVEDSLNGILYKDDSQITSITASKLYADVPRTVITLSVL